MVRASEGMKESVCFMDPRGDMDDGDIVFYCTRDVIQYCDVGWGNEGYE